ncbi:transposase, partial [Streptomyces eurythermus]|uniref:transposase n=1 Tax=Streptomyces eurythermus TaxID=42237 RepID=UPI003F4D4289
MVSDELWSLIEPLLSEPGPKLVAGRQALCGILFVLHTGIQWEYLPQELGFGSGMTCWRRLAAWNEAGVWEKLHLVLLRKL